MDYAKHQQTINHQLWFRRLLKPTQFIEMSEFFTNFAKANTLFSREH